MGQQGELRLEFRQLRQPVKRPRRDNPAFNRRRDNPVLNRLLRDNPALNRQQRRLVDNRVHRKQNSEPFRV